MLRPLNSTALPVDVISGEDVAGITLTPVSSSSPNDIRLNSVGYFAVKGSTSDSAAVVGLADVADITSETISICTVESVAALGDGAFLIHPLAVGECTVKATYRDLSATLSFQVIEGS